MGARDGFFAPTVRRHEIAVHGLRELAAKAHERTFRVDAVLAVDPLSAVAAASHVLGRVRKPEALRVLLPLGALDELSDVRKLLGGNGAAELRGVRQVGRDVRRAVVARRLGLAHALRHAHHDAHLEVCCGAVPVSARVRLAPEHALQLGSS